MRGEFQYSSLGEKSLNDHYEIVGHHYQFKKGSTNHCRLFSEDTGVTYRCTAIKKTWLSLESILETKKKILLSLHKIMKNSYLKHCNQLEQR